MPQTPMTPDQMKALLLEAARAKLEKLLGDIVGRPTTVKKLDDAVHVYHTILALSENPN